MHPEDPSRLGNYQVVRTLGAVPIGTTLLGTDQTGRAVVLTVVDPRIAAAEGFRERFAREARAAASAPPSFVAPVLDVDVAADPPWLATVAVPGPSLAELVGDRGPLGDAGAAALGRRLADGLAGLHASGLVHGDLTPSTIILAEEGPRLVGYGLSRLAGPGHGTPGFEAPEQAAGPDRPTDATADVFALGCVLGYAATGRSPFAAGDPASTRRRAAEAEPDLGAMAEPVRSVALGCLRRDPAQRLSAAQVAAALGPDPDATAVTGAPAGHAIAPSAPTRTLVDAPPVGDLSPRDGSPRGGSLWPPSPRTAAEGGAAGGPWNGPPGAPHPGAPGAVPPGAVRPGGAPPWPGPPSAPARRRGPLVAIVALAVVVVLAIAGGVALLVTRGHAVSPAQPTAASDPPAGSPGGSTAIPSVAPTAATATGTPDPGTGGTLVDATPFGADAPHFATPSRNIACQMSEPDTAGGGVARCDVAQRTWQLPAAPQDCQGVFGTGASVAGLEKGTLTCVGDTVADPALQVLQYGQALSFGGIVCDSQETGVRCVNRATGHGFRVARASYDLF